MAGKAAQLISKIGLFAFSIVFVVAFCVGLVLLVPGFVNWNKNKSMVTDYVYETTGYKAEIAGDLDISILPSPKILIGGLSLEVPDQTSVQDPVFLKVESIDTRLDLVSLLGGKIVVNEMIVMSPEARFTINEKKIYPPLLEHLVQSKGDESGDKKLPDVAFKKSIEVDHGKISIHDAVVDKTYDIEDIDIILETESVTGPFVIEGNGAYKGHEGFLIFNIGDLQKIGDQGLPWSTELTFAQLGAVLRYDGLYNFDEESLTGNISFDIQNLGHFFTRAGFDFAQEYLAIAQVPVDLEAEAEKAEAAEENPDQVLQEDVLLSDMELSGDAVIALQEKEFTVQDIRLYYFGEEGLNGQFYLTRSADRRINFSRLTLSLLKPFNIDPYLGTLQQHVEGFYQRTQARVFPDSGNDTFIPERLVLNKTVSAAVAVTAPEITIYGQPLKDLQLNIGLGEQKFESMAIFKSEDGGDFKIESFIEYGEKVVERETGAIILSAPKMQVDMQTTLTQSPHLLTNLAVRNEDIPLVPILVEPFEGSFTVKVTPRELGISSLVQNLNDADLDLKAIYQKKDPFPGEKDLLTLSVVNEGFIDLDKWLGGREGDTTLMDRLVAGTPEDLDMPPETIFPFDTVFSISLDQVRLKEQNYDKLFLRGRLDDLALDLDLAEVEAEDELIRLTGSVDNLLEYQGVDLAFTAETQDWRTLLDSWGVNLSALPFETGRAQASGTLIEGENGIDLSADLSVFEGILSLKAVLSGLQSGFSEVENISLDLQLPDYRDVVKAYYPDYVGADTLDTSLLLTADISREESAYRFKDLSAKLGPTSFKGDLFLDASGSKPSIEGALVFNSLPLDEYLALDAFDSFRLFEENYQEKDGLRWSREPIPMDWMFAANLDLKIDARVVQANQMLLRDVVLDMRLRDGDLFVREFKTRKWGGTLKAKGNILAISPELGTIRASGQFSYDGFEIDAQQNNFALDFPLRQCLCSISSTFVADGASFASMIFSLDGKGSLKGENVVVKGLDISQLRDIMRRGQVDTDKIPELLSEIKEGGYSEFSFMSGEFTITKGIVSFDELLWKGDGVTAISVGDINLPLWTMSLDNEITIQDVDSSRPLEIAFEGPIDAPKNTFVVSALEQHFQRQLKLFIDNKFQENKNAEPGRYPLGRGPKAIRAVKGLTHFKSN